MTLYIYKKSKIGREAENDLHKQMRQERNAIVPRALKKGSLQEERERTRKLYNAHKAMIKTIILSPLRCICNTMERIAREHFQWFLAKRAS